MRFLVSFLVLAIILILGGATVRADVNDFVINEFKANYILDNEVVGGSLETNEEIRVNFKGQNKGILRAIPKTYRGFDTKIDIRSVARDGVPEPYTTYDDSGNLVIKIGDANKSLTGIHVYNISYYQERVINFPSNGPAEFYWDVNGHQATQQFENVSATVSLKDGPLISSSNYCYTGVEGSKESSCGIVTESGKVLFETSRVLRANEGLTIATSLENIEFIQPGSEEKIKDNIINIVGIISGVVVSLFVFRIWHKHGKDYSGKKVIYPRYEPPEGLTPAEVGMLADYQVDSKDLSATLIDLAVRRYVKLHENVGKVLFVKSKKYSVELTNSDFSKLKDFEKELLDGIFENMKKGEIVELNKLDKSKMSLAVQQTKSDINSSLKKTHGYIEEKSTTLQTLFFVLGGASIFGSFFLFSIFWGVAVGVIIVSLSLLGFGILMRRRSHAGEEIYEEIMGLKMYMEVAEKDRLKMMQSVDRPFAEPSKTVELFEKLLPYAVALGVEKSWSKQFDGILQERPDWIDSNSTAAFSGAYLASSISSATSNFGSSFESNSSVSGSSGGGSSGGGGGGGGVGGW